MTQPVKHPTIEFQRSPSGRGTRLIAIQRLPCPRDRLFAFFADAFQLESLTPPWLRFHVVTPGPITISAGTLIDYRLRLRGVPVRWRSRISVWDPPIRFVDEQLRGPYLAWHHEHSFQAVGDETVCRDVVDYRVPGGWAIDKLLVRRDLRKIFTFRHQKLWELFEPSATATDVATRRVAATDMTRDVAVPIARRPETAAGAES